MHLLIDIGNTQAKFASYNSDNKIDVINAEKALSMLQNCLSVVVSSVASNEQSDKVLAQAKLTGVPITHVTVSNVEFGIQCAYENFATLGVDRWLAVLAAEKCFPNTPVLVVDAGTALTIDALSDHKQHLGGWIIPGLKLMQQSIVDKAPGVFISDNQNNQEFGTSTPAAVFNGCKHTCVAAIVHARAKLEKMSNNGVQVKVVMTGGDASTLQTELPFESQLIKELVFIGLARFIK